MAKRVLFNHLAKCAGSTITDWLRTCYSPDVVYETNGRNAAVSALEFMELPLEDRHRYRLIAGHATGDVISYAHPEMIKAITFREPVDRVVSYYHYMREDQRHPLCLTARTVPLDELLERPEFSNWYVAYLSKKGLEWTRENPETALGKALDVVSRYEVQGFYDQLPELGRTLRAMAELPLPFHNRRMNVTRKRPQVSDMKQSLIRGIEAANDLDIRLYKRLRWDLLREAG